ncbi:MAG TPA: hypothetical protein PKE04_10595, partial [Clostridia bacterium]|nr:hypothetical protein [Clostridia bacterium]
MVTQRMGALASALLKDVLAYLEWLLHEERLEITLHRLEPCLQACLDSLLPYNIHTNALCLYAKQSLAVWKQCIDCQVKVRARAEQGPFFGICWVGVSEFVVPIKTLAGDVIGFVCVSGYASDRVRSLRRIERVAGQYN